METEKTSKLTLAFTVTNPSEKAASVLQWFSPLEGIKSDCLTVTLNDQEIKYQGMMIKRKWPPPPEAYLTLSPGESFTTFFDVEPSYPLSEKDTYSITVALKSFTQEKPDNRIALSASLTADLEGVQKGRSKKEKCELKPEPGYISDSNTIQVNKSLLGNRNL